jgi:hypothetical protein
MHILRHIFYIAVTTTSTSLLDAHPAEVSIQKRMPCYGKEALALAWAELVLIEGAEVLVAWKWPLSK